jgi:hypothetical protein
MLDKRKFEKKIYIVIAITSCFVLILKQGMLNIRGELSLLIYSRGGNYPLLSPLVYAYAPGHKSQNFILTHFALPM